MTLPTASTGTGSRRRFVCSATASLALNSAAFPWFLRSLSSAASSAENDRVLVVYQFSGGNDGLNTVVPYGIDDYYRLRPKLAVPKERVLPINDELGIVDSARRFKQLFDEGNATIVQGVGYPNPNRSHFVSMDYWHTGVNSAPVPPTGWLGRALDDLDASGNETRALLHIGTQRNLAVEGNSHRPISFRQADQFGWAGPRDGQAAFERLNSQMHQSDDSPSAIGPLAHIRATAKDAVAASNEIRKAVNDFRSTTKWPGGPAGPSKASQDLRTVAALINSGFPARVYYVSQPGFDTHFGQNNVHPGLMKEWSEAVKTFHEELIRLRQDHRVLMFSFSEFGRRVKENFSGGTDHGVAGPAFLYGTPVAGGIIGNQPSLSDLAEGDLRHSIDFRSVYAGIVRDWFGADTETVIGKAFEPISFLS